MVYNLTVLADGANSRTVSYNDNSCSSIYTSIVCMRVGSGIDIDVGRPLNQCIVECTGFESKRVTICYGFG